MRTRLALILGIIATVASFFLMGVSCGQAAAVNPDTFERYALTTDWSPSWTGDGWSVNKAAGNPGPTYGITANGMNASNALHVVAADDNSGGSADWNVSLSKVVDLAQTAVVRFQITSPDNQQYARLGLTLGTPANYVGWVTFNIYNNVGSGFVNAGSTVAIPGASSLSMHTWYEARVEHNYATEKVRARLQNLDTGTSYDWSDWVTMTLKTQPDRVKFQFYGTVNVDEVGLIPEANAIILLGMGLLILRARK